MGFRNENHSQNTIGSSLTSQDASIGTGVFDNTCKYNIVSEELVTLRLPAFRLPEAPSAAPCPAPPTLLRAYLSLGAKICGPPALDREFKTIDFLTLLDLRALPDAVRQHFLG